MRRILIDHARRHAYAKRGGGAQQVSLEEAATITPDQSVELIRLDEALKSLSEMDPRRGQVVECGLVPFAPFGEELGDLMLPGYACQLLCHA